MGTPSQQSHEGGNPRSAAWGPGPSLHTRWTTLGVERHVDLWMKRSSVHSTVPGNDEGPRPQEGRGPAVGRGAGATARQRQRIDITRPATIAPKPMAKFQAPMDTMNGMRSPAT